MEEPVDVSCPWCGEVFTTFVDPSVSHQQYTEDCQVCCRPIVLSMRWDEHNGVEIFSERE